MLTENQAIEIAKEYALETGSGWDERFHEVKNAFLDGQSVCVVSTSDLTYSEELPWMMENMPNPVRYYIDMSRGKCIAVGGRGGAIIRLDE